MEIRQIAALQTGQMTGHSQTQTNRTGSAGHVATALVGGAKSAAAALVKETFTNFADKALPNKEVPKVVDAILTVANPAATVKGKLRKELIKTLSTVATESK